MKDYKDYIQLYPHLVGFERRVEYMKEALESGSFLPKTVELSDIDNAFKEWADKKIEMVSDEGKRYPTMELFSNQRFSEYSQSWKYVDENNNLLLNFKTITRENNPKYGAIHSNLWNIPGDKFFLMKRQVVLDDNGSESLLKLKMKMPTALDLKYKLSVFTTKYQSLNEFNMKINRMFNACQEYIAPNGHYMAMKLEGINDESQYNIDDRQYYSQTYDILVLAYIITEEDYRVEEVPLKIGMKFGNIGHKKPDVEFEIGMCEDEENPYYHRPVVLTINFPVCARVAKFTLPCDVIFDNILKENCRNWLIEADGKTYTEKDCIGFTKGTEVKVYLKNRIYTDKEAKITIDGYNPDVVYDESLDYPEIESDEVQFIKTGQAEAAENEEKTEEAVWKDEKMH